MQQTKTLLAASALLNLTTLTAEAALTAGTVGGQRVVYSSISDITWTGDANLLGTMMRYQGYDTMVNAIIAASPIIYDTPNFYDTPSYSGYHNVTRSDFNPYSYTAQVSWFGAKAFTGYLNSINYAGSNQWALPSTGQNTQQDVRIGTDSQFGELYYYELGATHGDRIPDTNHFINQRYSSYWSGSEDLFYSDLAWWFYPDNGNQGYWNKGMQYYAWAVSPGNVAAVPVPAAAWLFGSGLIGLMGWRRRYTMG